MEKKMETTIMGYIGTTIRIHSFIPSSPKESKLQYRLQNRRSQIYHCGSMFLWILAPANSTILLRAVPGGDLSPLAMSKVRSSGVQDSHINTCGEPPKSTGISRLKTCGNFRKQGDPNIDPINCASNYEGCQNNTPNFGRPSCQGKLKKLLCQRLRDLHLQHPKSLQTHL